MIDCEFTRQCLELEVKGAGPSELQAFLNSPAPGPEKYSRPLASLIYGRLEHGVPAGQEVGMINDIPSCRELIERIMGEAEQAISRLTTLA